MTQLHCYIFEVLIISKLLPWWFRQLSVCLRFGRPGFDLGHLGWEDPLEKEMAAHSSTLAWKIPWTEEPGRLQSMGSQRIGHD